MNVIVLSSKYEHNVLFVSGVISPLESVSKGHSVVVLLWPTDTVLLVVHVYD